MVECNAIDDEVMLSSKRAPGIVDNLIQLVLLTACNGDRVLSMFSNEVYTT